MDTRRVFGPDPSYRPAPDLGTDTVSIDLVRLVPVRYRVNPRSDGGFWALVSALLAMGLLTIIVVLAIASSAGWSVLNAWSG